MKLKIVATALLAIGSAFGLGACQSLTSAQDASLFCVISAGVVATVASTPTAAGKAAAGYSNSQVAACSSATQVGAVLGTK